MKERRSSLVFCYDGYMVVVVGHLVAVGATKTIYSFGKLFYLYDFWVFRFGSSANGLVI